MVKRQRRSLPYVLFFFGLLFSFTSFAATITQLTVQEAIGPATSDYLIRGIQSGQHSDVILIELNSTNGLIKPTRAIVKAMIASPVPIIVYVYPEGAKAANAGTFILYASTIAAMASGTHLGSGVPVNSASHFVKEVESDIPTTKAQLAMNHAFEDLDATPELHARHALFTNPSAKHAPVVTAAEALKLGVVNFLAIDRLNLLKQLNGYFVVQNSQQKKLSTLPPHVVVVQPDWRVKWLRVMTNPTLAYLVLLLGLYGLFFEIITPGLFLPGVVGVISFSMAVFSLYLLEMNYTALVFIILGMALVIGETVSESFGVLGAIGSLAFVGGSMRLLSADHPSFHIDPFVIGIMTLTNVLIFIVFLKRMVGSRQKSRAPGIALLVGAQGRTITPVHAEGQAVIRGEIWNVQSKTLIDVNRPILVIAAEGLTLEVDEDHHHE